ncbi:MAG: nicotinate-nucleotide adenylyltransferase [Kiritimatiellae bacterium]|nr:nicotinate-nucleotide adenylyltransferase [Kiritimatiellia bacterium]
MAFGNMGATALLGGSFDPVHRGHIAMAKAALRLLPVDGLVFIPTAFSPLKDEKARATDADRLAMLRLAVADEPRFSVTDMEITRGGVSYTVDTLREWRRLHPADEIFFIAGMDSLLTLRKWREPLEIVNLCRFVAFRRPGIPPPRAEDLGFEDMAVARRLVSDVVEGPMCDVSSSEIRRRVAAGEVIADLVTPEVGGYIADKGLYRKG